MIIFLIGPSGVGKTTLGEFAGETVAGCKFYDLDKLVEERTGKPASRLLPQIGNDEFLEKCKEAIRDLDCNDADKLCVVAIGAGALQSEKALNWLKHHETVAITAPATDVYKRGGRRNENRTLESFKDTEYSSRRREIYSSANHVLPVDALPVEEAKKQFVKLLSSIGGRGSHA
jgi:shikimate kinase